MEDAQFASTDAIMVECCAPIFGLTAYLQQPEQLTTSFRDDVEEAFLALERKAFEKQLPPTLVRDLKYAMAAYTDEMVMSSGWSGRMQWLSRPLCVEFFGDSNAGEGFFNRLTELEAVAAENRLILEHYYTCIQLGYQGIYKLYGQERLLALQSNLRSLLDELRGPVNRTLADSAAPESKLVYRLSGQQPYWVMAVLFSSAMIGMFAAYGNYTQDAVAASSVAISEIHNPQTPHDTALNPSPLSAEEGKEALQ